MKNLYWINKNQYWVMENGHKKWKTVIAKKKT